MAARRAAASAAGGSRAAPASGPARRRTGRQPAARRGRGHRHQRQDQHGRVPAPDLGRGRPAGRQPRHARPDRRGLRSRPGPDHTRSGQPGARPWHGSPAPASSTPRWRPRRTASTSSAWTACGWRPAAFTNLTRDHLDYHGSEDAYRAAKLRLFAELLPAGAPVVASSEMDATTLRRAGRDRDARRRLDLRTVGEAGSAIRLLAVEPRPDGQLLRIEPAGVRREVMLPLPGRFQADNALMAAALAAALGERNVLDRLASLRGVRGRLELAARLPNGAAVYVDYAHTPDALERLLTALRPHTAGQAACGVRRRRRSRSRQAPADGRRRGSPRRCRHRHRRQSAQRGPGRDPRRRACRLPRRARDRRPGARHRRGAERARRRRRAGGGRQGPRAGADDRRHGDPVRRCGVVRRLVGRHDDGCCRHDASPAPAEGWGVHARHRA